MALGCTCAACPSCTNAMEPGYHRDACRFCFGDLGDDITHELDGEPMCSRCARHDDWDDAPDLKAQIKPIAPDVGF